MFRILPSWVLSRKLTANSISGPGRSGGVEPNTSKPELQRFIEEKVVDDSIVIACARRCYEGLPNSQPTIKYPAKQFVEAMAHMNGVDAVWAILNQGY